MKNIKKITISVIVSTLLLTGCGGGGGSDAQVSITPSTDNPVTEAAKEMQENISSPSTIITGITNPIVKNGQIIILDPMGHKIGGGVTDDNGHYSINIGHYEGPVQVVLICGENSKVVVNGMEMKCPMGEMMKVSENIAESGAQTIINITFLGDLTNFLAGSFGALTPKNIQKSKKTISLLFGGIDPIKTDPYSYNYQSILKALQESAKEQGKSVKELIKEIEEQIEKGYITKESKNTRSFLEKLILREIYNALIEAVNESGIFNIDVEEPTKNDIELAKSMIEDLKEEAPLIIDYKDKNKEGILIKEAKNFEKTAKDIVMPTTKYTINASVLIAKTIKEAIDTDKTSLSKEFKTEKETFTLFILKQEDDIWNYKIENENNSFGGKATIPKNIEVSEIYTLNGTIPPAKDFDDVKEENINLSVKVLDKSDEKWKTEIKGEISSLHTDKTPLFKTDILSSKVTVLKENNDITASLPENIDFHSVVKEYDIEGKLIFKEFVKNETFSKNGGFLPKTTIFEGEAQNLETLTNFNGKTELILKDINSTDFSTVSKENPPPYILKIAGDLTTSDLKRRAISAYIEYLDNDTVKVEASSSFDNKAINATGTMGIDYKNEKITSFDLDFTNQDSVEFKVKADNKNHIEGEVKKESEILGEIKKIDDIPFIKYKDGSLQSLI